VALTFDAGSDNVAYSLIRNALVKAGVKSTFFLTGEWLSSYPEEAKQLANDGMEFGNHSWSHPNFTTISGEAIRSEVNRTENQLVKVTGKSSKPLLRFPYGARDSRTTGVINQLGYRSIFWSLDSLDSVGQPKTVDFIVQRITGQTDAQLDGAIILMHLGARTSGEALPQIIQNLQARGFKLVTVSQLLK
jgi:peptidoglycan/xylan/chitin deacetylase (PgdA/CDA1 family)